MGRTSSLLEGSTPLIESTFGIFIISFFGYVAAGVTFSLVSKRDMPQEFFLFSAASLLYFLSVFLSFSGLLVLARIFDVSFLITIVSFLIVGSAVGGHIVVFATQIDLLGLSWKTAVIVFFLAASLAGCLVSVILATPALRDGGAVLRAVLWAPTVAIVALFLSAMLSLFWQGTECRRGFAAWSLVLSGLAVTAVFLVIATAICCAVEAM